MRTHLSAAALLTLLAACGGSIRGTVVELPGHFPGFPTQASVEGVWAEATFFTNHGDIFGTDLTRDGILPVALRLGVRGGDETDFSLSDDFDPHLYLQDGVALRWAPVEALDLKNEDVTNRIAELALRPSLLETWDDTPTVFLFFRFDDDDIRVDEVYALSRSGDLYHEVDLLQSLLSFTITGPDGPSLIHVGLKGGRWAR